MRRVSCVGLLFQLVASNAWGAIDYPSDVAVSLSASPSAGLATGQVVQLTLAVTNNGPVPLDYVFLSSTEFRNEFAGGSMKAECRMVASVLEDGEPISTYVLWWVPTRDGPMAAGETRTCHLQLALSQHAPTQVAWTWGLLESDTDPVPTNDRATVLLRRAVESVPLASPLTLGVAAALLVLMGWQALFRHRPSA